MVNIVNQSTLQEFTGVPAEGISFEYDSGVSVPDKALLIHIGHDQDSALSAITYGGASLSIHYDPNASYGRSRSIFAIVTNPLDGINTVQIDWEDVDPERHVGVTCFTLENVNQTSPVGFAVSQTKGNVNHQHWMQMRANNSKMFCARVGTNTSRSGFNVPAEYNVLLDVNIQDSRPLLIFERDFAEFGEYSIEYTQLVYQDSNQNTIIEIVSSGESTDVSIPDGVFQANSTEPETFPVQYTHLTHPNHTHFYRLPKASTTRFDEIGLRDAPEPLSNPTIYLYASEIEGGDPVNLVSVINGGVGEFLMTRTVNFGFTVDPQDYPGDLFVAFISLQYNPVYHTTEMGTIETRRTGTIDPTEPPPDPITSSFTTDHRNAPYMWVALSDTPKLILDDPDMLEGGTVTGEYENFTGVPEGLTLTDTNDNVLALSVNVTPITESTGTFSFNLPSLPVTGSVFGILFGPVTVSAMDSVEMTEVGTLGQYHPTADKTATTLGADIDPYLFTNWTRTPVEGEQLITNTVDGIFYQDGSLETNSESTFDFWFVENTGEISVVSINTENLSEYDPSSEPEEPTPGIVPYVTTNTTIDLTFENGRYTADPIV